MNDLVFQQRPEPGLTTPLQEPGNNPCVEFRDGQFHLSMMNSEGGRIERFVSTAAVREAFSGIPIDTGWIRPEVVRWGDGKTGEWAVAFFPPAVIELEITREGPIVSGTAEGAPDVPSSILERLPVSLPGLVWFGIGTNYFVWATKAPQFQPHHTIFRCPLPNVYQHAEVCWGLIKPPRATARTLFQAWDLFIKSTFNNHLASGKSKRHREDVRVLLREVKDVYPVEDLVPQTESKIALDTMIRKFFETGAMPE